MICKDFIRKDLCCFTMVIGVYCRGGTLCWSGRRAILCSSMKTAPRSTLMARYSTAVNSVFVSRSLSLTFDAMLHLVLSRGSAVDRKDGFNSIHTV